MKIAIVAAEITPYAKAGGLADVIGALPGALAAAGCEVSVVFPGYRSALKILSGAFVADRLTVEVGARQERFTVRGAPGAGGVRYYLIEHPEYFGREGIYGEKGRDYPDNLRRYVFFGRAAAETIARLIKPDVVHAHDWHAAMVPIVIGADPAMRESFARALSIFTIHNLAFQGICDAGEFPILNLDWSYFSIDCLEFFGNINLMKGAVMLADGASTVSPTYAREVTTSAELGFGLEGVLRHKGARFVGILNGADYHEWDPARDEIIATRYEPSTREGKRACTADLRQRVGLPAAEGAPVIGMITRMTPQKGLDLLKDALDAVMAMDLQLVILGSGDPGLESYFREAEARYPGSPPDGDRVRQRAGPSNPGRLGHLPDAVEVRAVRAYADVRAQVRHRAGGPRDRRIARHDQRVRPGIGRAATDSSFRTIAARRWRRRSSARSRPPQSRALGAPDGQLLLPPTFPGIAPPASTSTGSSTCAKSAA